jgi:hypothetical protein
MPAWRGYRAGLAGVDAAAMSDTRRLSLVLHTLLFQCRAPGSAGPVQSVDPRKC